MGNGAALAFSPFGVLIVGVEPDIEGATRVYVGHRARGLYFTVTGEDAEKAKRAWDASFHGHLLIHRDGIPHPLIQDASAVLASDTEGEE